MLVPLRGTLTPLGRRYAATSTSAAGPEDTLITNLVSWWKLDETSGTRADSVGSNTLTDNNTVLAGGGVGSYALSCNGSSQYVEAAGAAVAITNKATLSVWTYTSAIGADDCPVSVYNAGTGDYILIIASNSTPANAVVYANDGASGVGTITSYFTNNAWQHTFIEYDGTQPTDATRLKVWKNGVAQTFASFASAIPATLSMATALITVGIGGGKAAASSWSGRVQAFGLWNVVGSTTAAEQYNSGRGLRYAELTTAQKVGMFDFWELGEASGNRVGSHAATALTPTNTPGRLAGIVNSAKTSTGANFVSANSESLSKTDADSLDLAATWTIATWINPTSLTTNAGIVNKGTTNQYSYLVGLDGADASKIKASVAANLTDNFTAYVTTPASTLAAGGWYRVVVTFNAGTFAVWVNGVSKSLTTTGSIPTTTPNGAAALYLGAKNAADYFNGAMEETAIASRVWTDAEIAYDYNSDVGRTYSGGQIL